jgi:hypothetical protein
VQVADGRFHQEQSFKRVSKKNMEEDAKEFFNHLLQQKGKANGFVWGWGGTRTIKIEWPKCSHIQAAMECLG